MHRRARTLSVVVIAVALLVGVAIVLAFALRRPAAPNTAGTPSRPPATAPDPKLSPGEVVLAVLAALKDNGPDDAGIRTTFRFASPANQAATGPVERFVAMVKRPPYDALINHRSARVRPLDVIGGAATALVTVTDRDAKTAHFLWQLSRQSDGPQKDCWMTDGVTPVRPPPGPPSEPPPGPPADDAEKA
jgi:hypothetical protein